MLKGAERLEGPWAEVDESDGGGVLQGGCGVAVAARCGGIKDVKDFRVVNDFRSSPGWRLSQSVGGRAGARSSRPTFAISCALPCGRDKRGLSRGGRICAC